MLTEVKRRAYDGTRRREAASRTRAAVLEAAYDLFTTKGYAATPVHEIAARAGVSVDTLYASVGRKPQLLLAVHDMVLAEGDSPVDAEQRDYVVRIRAAPTAREKIAVYAEALGRLLPETVPLLEALRAAGRTDGACRDVYESVMERRAGNMRRFVAELRATGQMREDVDDETAAALVWSMNAPEYFALVRSRGLTPMEYAGLVRDVWERTLLATHAGEAG